MDFTFSFISSKNLKERDREQKIAWYEILNVPHLGLRHDDRHIDYKQNPVQAEIWYGKVSSYQLLSFEIREWKIVIDHELNLLVD